MKTLRIVIASALFIFLGGPFLGNEIKVDVHPEKSFKASGEGEGKTSESWMGIYMNGIKIGYSHSQELALTKNGMTYRKEINETRMKVSRLGGNPVEMVSVQESLYDKRGKALECILRMKMSESETVLKAEIAEDKILFKSEDKLIKELPYDEEFYLETPLEKIIAENGLKPGQKLNFKILNPLSYSLADCRFEVIGKEEVLILGNKMNLWHIKEEMVAVIPVIMDEWIDGSGECWKTVSRASLITSTSIRMPKEKALEVSEENFDIAFSTLIRPNMTLESPREVQKATFRLSGVAPDKIKNFPFDDGSQKILEAGKDYVVIETSSQVFREEEALGLPVKDEQLRRFLKPTSFCQADDPEIQEAAKRIVGSERNSWRAAKKIAEWVKEEMTPNYDVGFATAKEVLRNRKGDCSEHTVITVALCRAAGIPARAAVGIMYAQGIFAYHLWPEVYVGRWIGLDAKWLAVDRKSGEYYTDATHLKFGRSLLDENIFKEMAQAISEIVGQLKLEIVDYSQDK